MKKIVTIILILNTTICFGQKQWFPLKIDSITNKLVADTTKVFPVCFIELKGLRIFMYGHGTNYSTEMKRVKDGYFSSHLTMPRHKNSIEQPYIKAHYFLKFIGNKGILKIKLAGKTDTIIFIKSEKNYKNINSGWG